MKEVNLSNFLQELEQRYHDLVFTRYLVLSALSQPTYNALIKRLSSALLDPGGHGECRQSYAEASATQSPQLGADVRSARLGPYWGADHHSPRSELALEPGSQDQEHGHQAVDRDNVDNYIQETTVMIVRLMEHTHLPDPSLKTHPFAFAHTEIGGAQAQGRQHIHVLHHGALDRHAQRYEV